MKVAVDEPAALHTAADALERGEAIVLPTETVYGVATLATAPGAAAKIFTLKGRPSDVPLPVIVDGLDQVEAWVEAPAPGTAAARLVERLWPGPLTVVLRRKPGASIELGGADDTIGLRCPDHAFVRTLARRVGPLVTTSANRHGAPTPPTATDAAAALEGDVAVVVDGGRCEGVPSTVVDATDPTAGVRVLRVGAISEDEIQAVVSRP